MQFKKNRSILGTSQNQWEKAIQKRHEHMGFERLSREELSTIDACWRACNYLAIGMIYQREPPFSRNP